MVGNEGTAAADRARAHREREARRLLLDAGADGLPRRPWQAGAAPPADVDLLRFALWWSTAGAAHPGAASETTAETSTETSTETTTEVALAALRLLPAARAELDQVEAAVLFTARACGLTWARMADALGLGSAQACQQRFDRLTTRTGGVAT
ncbi:hypothetical protein [Kineococcus glutinatus]|uniref:DNA-binding protein n=1 Tax=Kineococcus glutinatus TaxID=1070872 RepID=A0ABP9HHV5_9ACTN